MTGKEATQAGWRALRMRPLLTVAAALASATATIAAATAFARAAQLARAAFQTDPGLFGRAALTLFLGGSCAALLQLAFRACALTAYAGAARPLYDGLSRMPYMVSVAAVELTVQGMLLFGALMVIGRAVANGVSPAGGAAIVTLTLAPGLVLSAILFVAARVAVTLVARGLHPAPALVSGLDVAWRRLPSLLRLGVAILRATLPLLAGALALTVWAASLERGPAEVVLGVRALLLSLAVLWSYAALTIFIGRDPRLAGG